ncbi:MAG: prolipoprotein diacylglyceryl transferase [Candidatus Limivicinus sp.]|jgi:phosphatidylglycerol:prolipoprotein diacylglycerol transferase
MFQFLLNTIQRDSVISFPMFGDVHLNPPSYITIFGKNIYFYGILIALGFILAIVYCSRICGRFGIKENDLYDIMLWIIPLSIVGARLYFVLFKLDYYIANPSEIFAIWEGGLAIYGGVIAGILVVYFVCRHKKIPVLAVLDVIVFGLLIGQIIGRWGNFMNREAFGGETTVFCRMGLTDPSGHTIYVHPTFLYESLWNLAGLIFLIVFTKKGHRKYDGQCVLIYFLWYGIGRAWIEGLRTDSLYIGSTGIRVSQLLSALLALAALIILIVQSRREHPAEELYVNRVLAEKKAEEEAEGNEA